MGELSWRDLDESAKSTWHWTWHHTVGAILVTCALLSTAVLVLPVRDLLASPADLAVKYARSPSWLNRCDHACARGISVSFLDGQKHCSALSLLFLEDSRADLYAWRLAVDDRASALGCPGFPQSLAAIRESVARDADARRTTEDALRLGREQQAQEDAAQIVRHYERSLAEGDLDQYVERVVQDPIEHSLVYVTVNESWKQLPPAQRLPVTQTLWQKWAILRTPADPWKSSAMFIDSEGILLGEAPSDGEDVWLAE